MTYQFANSVQNKINELFANSVVTTGVVIRSIFLSCDELLRVEKLTVCTSAHLIWKDGQCLATGALWRIQLS